MPIIVGCNKSKKVSGSDFQNIYETRNLNTMHYSEYLGHKDDKVYILRKTMSLTNENKWNEEIVYADIAELESSFKEQILKNSKELEEIE